jgi:sugar/nucleoside kinase (ribokinase family)
MKRGLFVGLSTLDFIYLSEKLPETNQKLVAIAQSISAGGPATNAAITFNYLGDRATLLSVVGNHPLSQIIQAELETYSLQLVDLAPHYGELPSVSSIIVTQNTGERAVISVNATKFQANLESIKSDFLENIEIVLIDGHQMNVSLAIAQQAKAKKIPIVIDGGSWKPGFETILPLVDYGICSSNFLPPHCRDRQEVFSYLQALGVPHIAITQGEKSIQYLSQGQAGEIEISPIKAIDTLGAGDIFHGAFCHYILQKNFSDALILASHIATRSCQFFGTRQWMETSSKFRA